MYLGMESVIRHRGYDTLEDAGDISGVHNSSFGVDEPATVGRMLSWIDEGPADSRFFITYMPIAGHHPYDTPEPGPCPEEREIDRYRTALHGCDAAIGRLVSGLKERGLDRNTLLVIVGDHGQVFGQHEGNSVGHSFFVYDEITIGDLTLTPGLRYEDIDQQRTRWETRDGMTSDPGSRDPSNLRDTRSNRSQVWIPGLGALYAFNDTVALYGGIHKGFTAPSNAPGVAEEQSINYELGLRYSGDRTYIDSAVFFTDYDNLLGECTSSSGAECEVGDAFNGDAASVLGLEILLTRDLVEKGNFSMPLTFSYTYLDATFDSDIADTIFFGDVSKGDPLPYIPNHQFLASIGFQTGRFGSYLNANYVDQTCVRASCGEFETTDNILTLDISANYQFSEHINFYGRVNNLTDDQSIVARHPYGARPNLGRTAGLGIRISL